MWKWWLAGFTLLAVLVYALRPQPEVRVTATVAGPQTAEQQPQASAALIAETPAAVVLPQPDDHPGAAAALTEAAVITPRPEVVESLREARLNGDSRTPPLNQSRQRDELPSAEQLQDPELYQQYERRQQQRMYRAYVEASKIKVAELEKMIERGRREGISAEQIAFAEQKAQGIQQMAEQLQQQHPEIMADDFAPADDWLTPPAPRQQGAEQTEQTVQ